MSIHQTSVYVGTAGRRSWPAPWASGTAGARRSGSSAWWGWSTRLARVPDRRARPGQGRRDQPVRARSSRADRLEAPAAARPSFRDNLAESSSGPRPRVMLLVVFAGANFVAAVFLTWLPRFRLPAISSSASPISSIVATIFPMASLVGALCGGVLADLRGPAAGGAGPGPGPRPDHRGAVHLSGRHGEHDPAADRGGWSRSGSARGSTTRTSSPRSIDVVRPQDPRDGGRADEHRRLDLRQPRPAGRRLASASYGLSAAIASTPAVYVVAGLLALVAARWPPGGKPSPVSRSGPAAEVPAVREGALTVSTAPRVATAAVPRGRAAGTSTPSSG